MKKIFLFCVLNLMLMSCTTLYKGGYSSQPIIPPITVAPIYADLIIDTSKVLQGSSTTTVVFKIFKTGDSEFSEAFIRGIPMFTPGTKEEMAATYKALAGTGNDIIVNPKYILQIEKHLFVKKTTATVSGYGAKIKLNRSKNTYK